MNRISHNIRLTAMAAITALLVAALMIMHARDLAALSSARERLRDAQTAQQTAEARVYNPAVAQDLAQINQDIEDLRSLPPISGGGHDWNYLQDLNRQASALQQRLWSAPIGTYPTLGFRRAESLHRQIQNFVSERRQRASR